MLLMVVGLGSCKKDKNEPTTEPTKITLSESNLTLKVGDSKQLKAIVLPKGQKFTVNYTSDKPEVATVDAKGLVTAVAEGTAKVTAMVGKLSAVCVVTVSKTGAPAPQANELPLLKFNPEGDQQGNLTDKAILDHEKKVGRVAENVTIGGQGPFPGFVNKDLTIPAVVYGLGLEDGTAIIAAVSKESLADCPKTTAMLKEYGFTKLEDKNLKDGTPVKFAKKDDDESMSVLMQDFKRKDGYGAKMQIMFVKVPEQKDLPIAHPIIADVKDFPDWTAFMTSDVAKMKDFEAKLGFREFDAKQSDVDKKNLAFITSEAKMAKTNFSWVYYVTTPTDGGKFINSQVTFIKNAKDFADPKLKDWFTANGFGKDFKASSEKGFAYGFDATGKIVAQVAIQKFKDGSAAALLQIFENTDTQSAAQMRRLAVQQYEQMQPRTILNQHKLQLLRRR